jgi:hypothetical protein
VTNSYTVYLGMDVGKGDAPRRRSGPHR